ncbi:hypothetical protein [Spirosoma foliorum]|uniref:Uncharacterized protein n=1 Tax=Spirosoma foliorum TaxID=2710596 RepID=A0A7G5H004_9BACT|nr:hypothetical protein [Spirosoma foliorum]QMW04446.1 hypothetical protein H3H32_05755 [Spirosoma foliorum]
MTKLILFLYVWILPFTLQAQQQIVLKFQQAFGPSASVVIQLKSEKVIVLSFLQTDVYNENQPTYSWGRDSSATEHPKKPVIYFQASIADRHKIKADQFRQLFTAFADVYANRERLAKVKDDRLFADGISCEIIIEPYQLMYFAPGLTGNDQLDKLMEEALKTIHVKSKNRSVLRYCNQVLKSYFPQKKTK